MRKSTYPCRKPLIGINHEGPEGHEEKTNLLLFLVLYASFVVNAFSYTALA
jgi:hypothetical protein